MTPQEFVEKWSRSALKESAGSQEHFIDLCRLLEEPTPAEADPKGEEFTFEKGAMKTGGGGGWADVWKRGHFAWEYKGKNKDLDAAFAQLQRYAIALENPPLLIVSDMERFIIHTNWTNTVQEIYEIELDELLDGRRRQILKYAFADPAQLKPRKTRQDLTEEVAASFARLALHLRERGHNPEAVAHFVNRLVFCMFAEDVDLLPNRMFTRMLEVSQRNPEEFEEHCRQLFAAMGKGGPVGFERVEWFNGGLFDDDSTLPLNSDDIRMTLIAARKDWSNIELSVMGTLFERGLDPDKRSQLGAHYTDRDKIMLIVNPVIVEPLTREWQETRGRIETLADERQKYEGQIKSTRDEAQELLKAGPEKAKAGEAERRNRITNLRSRATRAQTAATELRDAFLEHLRTFRVLDPACGSGNFLYLALLALKDLEHKANLDAEALGIPRRPPRVGPECLKGIEINPFAAELARVSVWIGEIQWMRANGFSAAGSPILKPLDTIECRDALLNADGTEAEWPKADVIVGNPPFLGNKRIIEVLGSDYAAALRNAYADRLTRGIDLVIYWFDKAWQLIQQGVAARAGLVGTQAVRRGANRLTLARIVDDGRIFNAWADEPWIVEGAAVRVSLICFDQIEADSVVLNGATVSRIDPDLVASTGTGEPATLQQNLQFCFQGPISGGPFEVRGDLAREWLSLPLNPNHRPNSDVLFPWRNADDLTDRCSDTWIIDFSPNTAVSEASLFEAPFKYLQLAWECEDEKRRQAGERLLREGEPRTREQWWRLQRPRPQLRVALSRLRRFVATPRVAKFRTFVWLNSQVRPDTRLVVIAKDDDLVLGMLHSRHHELWSLRYGARHGVGNDPEYVHTKIFFTFPFPEGLTPDIPAAGYADDPRARAIAEAAKRLNELRENWLNPEDLVARVPEVVEGYPDRIVPKDEKAAAILKKRTLTNLYNERPAWLDHAHKALDAAVAAAYGWPAALSDDEILERLFHLNQERAVVKPDTS